MSHSSGPTIVRGALIYGVLAIVTLIAISITQGIGLADLYHPIRTFNGDGVLQIYEAKALGEGTYYHNPRVGAPRGLDYYDIAQPAFMNQIPLAVFDKLTGNPFVSINAYYILGFLLTSCGAFWVFQKLGISVMTAFVCAMLYAFMPFHMLRSYYHLSLSSYYLIPFVALLALRIMWEDPAVSRNSANASSQSQSAWVAFAAMWRSRAAYPWMLVAVLAGGIGIYYAAYSLLLLSAASVYALCRPARRPWGLLGLTSVVLLGLTVAASMIPILQYDAKFGQNSQVAKRSVGQTDILSLKLVHLLLPMPQDRVESLRKITAEYNDGLPVLNGNESQFAALGALGAAGFVILVLCSLGCAPAGLRQGLTGPLASLNLTALLFAITGGVGTLVSLLVTPQLRAHNRIVAFIGFFSLLAIALVIDNFRQWLSGKTGTSMAANLALALILIAGLYDQTPPAPAVAQMALKSEFDSEDQLFHQIEAELPAGASVLQLPYETFPEGPPVYQMDGYDHLRGYLHSKSLKWSFPTMRGRPGDDWIRELSSKPTARLVREAALAGFSGIYVNRHGYADGAGAIASELRAATGSKPLTSYDNSLMFFRLAGTAQGANTTGVNNIATKTAMTVEFGDGVYAFEHDGDRAWHWCNQKGALEIFNPSSEVRQVRLVAQLFSAFPKPATVVFRLENNSTKAVTSSLGSYVNWALTLKPGVNHITFSTDADRVPNTPPDTRLLYFLMQHVTLVEE